MQEWLAQRPVAAPKGKQRSDSSGKTGLLVGEFQQRNVAALLQLGHACGVIPPEVTGHGARSGGANALAQQLQPGVALSHRQGGWAMPGTAQAGAGRKKYERINEQDLLRIQAMGREEVKHAITQPIPTRVVAQQRTASKRPRAARAALAHPWRTTLSSGHKPKFY